MPNRNLYFISFLHYYYIYSYIIFVLLFLVTQRDIISTFTYVLFFCSLHYVFQSSLLNYRKGCRSPCCTLISSYLFDPTAAHLSTTCSNPFLLPNWLTPAVSCSYCYQSGIHSHHTTLYVLKCPR